MSLAVHSTTVCRLPPLPHRYSPACVTRRTADLGAPRDEDHVFAPAVRGAVEPAIAGLDHVPGFLEQVDPLVARDPGEGHSRGAVRALDRERQRPRVRVPVCALVDVRFALEPAAVRLGDVVVARGEDVEDQASSRDESRSSRSERLCAVAVVGQVQVRAKRADHEGHGFVERRVPEIAEPQIEQLGDAGLLGTSAARGEHLARRVDPDHALPRLGDRNRNPASADPELEHGPARLPRRRDVETDVLDDAPAPRIVELGDRVVRARLHAGFLATQTNSPLCSSNGVRSKSPYSASTSSPETSTSPSHSLFVTHQSETLPPDSSVMSSRLSPGKWSTRWRMPCCTSHLPSFSAAIRGLKTNEFQTKRPPGARAAATRSNTWRLSPHVGRWSSARNGQ